MENRRNIAEHSEKGFTFIEIVLAVVVIGILIAIIVPRMQRANVDAKYVGVRQAAAEIGRWGMDWATRNLESQLPDTPEHPVAINCNLNNYVKTLAGYVGNINNTNWINVNDNLEGTCRAEDHGITYSVAAMMPPDSQPRNPFNGASYFNTGGANSGDNVQAGLLYLGVVDYNQANHYYFVYTGTGSNAVNDWYAGMGEGENPDLEYAELRNGIFMTRQVP
ncbi:MAG: hypothetical protein SRB2_02560 [Desulfobacteraceae bacterium Eth-SRB2]|nr:MAG: hypothetical protein SRB2_02560 [Desulfobacteraceae bacterium Eth-SRB2]